MLLENMLLRPGDWKWLLAGGDDGEEVATAGATSVSWGAPLASWREFVARRSSLVASSFIVALISTIIHRNKLKLPGESIWPGCFEYSSQT